MKQKVAVVSAFMHNPQILILDEPTSGFDPLMQLEFTKLIAEEKKKGKTILMSSHNFEEVEKIATPSESSNKVKWFLLKTYKALNKKNERTTPSLLHQKKI